MDSIRCTAVFALAAAMACSGTARADDIAGAHSELANLGFLLTDLDPGDGITPAWTLAVGTTTVTTNVLQQQAGLFTPMLNDIGTARAFVTADSVGSEVTLPAGLSSSSAWAITTSRSTGVNFGLTLTPHTRLTLEAFIDVEVWRRDPDCVPTGVGDLKACLFVEAGTELHAMDNNHVFGNDGGFGVVLLPGKGGSSASILAPYTFVYENTTDLPTQVDFQVTSWASAHVETIPEPGSGALALGGLALAGVLSRRNARASARRG